MQLKSFQDIFQLYFHNKYSYSDFLNTQPIINKNIFLNKYKNRITYNYKLENSESQKLKNYHTFLNNLFFSKLKVHNKVYSYRENHTILQMLTLHKDNKYYFKTDIQSFFDSITSNMIKNIFESSIENIPKEPIVKLIIIDNKLPAGFVSSPNISNAVLYKFDNDIDKYCQSNDIIYSRYSDDLVFSSMYKFENIENIISNILNHHYNNAFVLNEHKSKYLDKTNRVQILGLVITPDGHITVPKKEKENIKKLIYFYMNDKNKFDNFLDKNYNNSIAKAYGKLNYINDIDIYFTQYLRKKYGNFIVDKFLHGDKRIG